MGNSIEKIDLESLKKKYGGYWRYNFLDFHYLYNSYFPNNKIISSLKEELPCLVDYYPSTQKVIAEILSKWREESWFNSDNLIIGNGSSELIRILNNLIESVVIPIPVFNEYTQIAEHKIKYFYAKEEDDFSIDTRALLHYIKNEKCKYLIINNPNNPTGQLIDKIDISKFLDLGIKVIVDEAFIDWSGNGNSCEDLIETYDNLIVIKSLTKTTGTGGLRLGYLLTKNNEIKDYIRKQLPIWNINSIAERFLELLVENKKAYYDSISRVIHDRETLLKELSEIKYITPLESQGNFLFCKTQISAQKIEKFLFDEHKIMIKAGIKQADIFSDWYFRVGIRTKVDNQKLVNALKNYMEKDFGI